jgi:NADPH:quinone reductase-like Zn-dependent oxidoreductase
MLPELTWSATYTTREGADRLPSIPGHDLSGTVERVAPGVTNVRPGEHVYALTDFFRDGSAAELIAVRAEDLSTKPAGLDHAQAAAVPLSALTAWQAFFDHAGLTRGQRVLIHGASGGVGTYAVQLARWCGAHVIARARTADADFLRGLGAAEVFDDAVTRFEDVVREVDVVLDTVGGDTLARSWRVLRRGGVLVSVATNEFGDDPAKHGVRAVFFIVKPSGPQLAQIRQLCDSGQVVPVIDLTFPLEKMGEAYRTFARTRHRGKSVLVVP